MRRLPKTAEACGITVTADIASLYTNISADNGEADIIYYYGQYPGLLLQDNLYFTFGDQVYRQKDGTGMGRKYAPSLADIKQGHDEIKIEEKNQGLIFPCCRQLLSLSICAIFG